MHSYKKICGVIVRYYSINFELKLTKSTRDNILKNLEKYFTFLFINVLSLVSNLNRGHAILECVSIASIIAKAARILRIVCERYYPSNLFWDYISKDIAYLLSLSLSRKRRLQEFNCGSYATFMAEIKSASWVDLTTVTNILVDILDVRTPLKPRKKKKERER